MGQHDDDSPQRSETGEANAPPANSYAELQRLREENARLRVQLEQSAASEEGRLEAALQHSEARLALTVQAARIGLWNVDLGPPLHLEWSRRAYEIAGLEPGRALTPEDVLSVVHPDDLPQVEQTIADARDVRGDGFVQVELRLVRPDASTRWVAVLGQVIFAGEGAQRHITHAMGTLIDISGRKEVEERLRERERELAGLAASLEARVVERTQALEQANDELTRARDLFRSVFEASPVAAVLSRVRNGVIIDVNDRFVAFFGHPRETLIGSNTVELDMWAYPEVDQPVLRARVLNEGSVRDVEIEVRTQAGEARTVLASIEALELDGEPCALTMFVDITERVEAEARVRALSGALTLAEQRERRRISQMLHDDLQQVLFGLEMRFHLLQRALTQHQVGGEPAERLRDVERLTRQAIELTRTLSLELDPPVLRSEGLAAALEWLAAHMAQRHGLEVELELEPGFDAEGADQRALIIQLVRELLFNVVKHAGVLRAHVHAWCTRDALVVEVADEGRGFDPARTTLRGATTFGLRSVRERLQLFGGALDIEARPGRGTLVRIRVPTHCITQSGSTNAAN